RFGDYGLIGVAILTRHPARPGVIELDTLLMSCRALGRGIEDAVLHDLLEVVRGQGGEHLAGQFVAGPRNQPMQAFLRRTGFRNGTDNQWVVKKPEVELPAHLQWEGPVKV